MRTKSGTDIQQLAKGVRSGDERDFETLFRLTHFRVIRYLKLLLPDNKYIDDIAQEVYIRIWQNRDQIDVHQSFEGWLFTIVRNAAITQVRKNTAEKKRLLIVQDLVPDQSMDNEGLSRLQYQDRLDQYTEAARSLDSQHLRCYRLHREEGLTYSQIAERESISVKTVEKYISTVLREFRKVPRFLLFW